MEYIRAVSADAKKNIFDIPRTAAVGMCGSSFFPLTLENTIELPYASELFVLPNRKALAFDPISKQTNLIENILKKNNHDTHPNLAVAAFVSPGYTQTATTAYIEQPQANQLPLFSYTAIGFLNGKFRVAAIRVDPSRRQDLRLVNKFLMHKNISDFLKMFPKNRLIRHLKKCAELYACPAAINFFLKREECPLPTSPYCNANCLGCISLQPSECCPSTQNRINFFPTPDEIKEIACFHIKNARNPVVSFGQGCEGEPLLAGIYIEKSIELIRQNTQKGTINLNTNASLPNMVERLCKNGLNSMRVSLNSVRKKYYDLYYRPKKYNFEDVCQSITIARKHNVFVSLNYLTIPGFTDQKEEADTLIKFIKQKDINMIQWRNLNYDPQLYFSQLHISRRTKLLGIKNLLGLVKKKYPNLRFGYFNPHLKTNF